MTNEFIIKLTNEVNNKFNSTPYYIDKCKWNAYKKNGFHFDYQYEIMNILKILEPNVWEFIIDQNDTSIKADFRNKVTGETFEVKVAFETIPVKKIFKDGRQKNYYRTRWENNITYHDPNMKFNCLFIEPTIIDGKVKSKAIYYIKDISFNKWKKTSNRYYLDKSFIEKHNYGVNIIKN